MTSEVRRRMKVNKYEASRGAAKKNTKGVEGEDQVK